MSFTITAEMLDKKPNVTLRMDYRIPTKPFAFGKTPLSVRVARFVDNYTFTHGVKPKYIPLQPTEYNRWAESAAWTGVAECWGTRYLMLPLGVRPDAS